MKNSRLIVLSLSVLGCAVSSACETRPKSQANTADFQVRKEVNVALQRYADAARAVDANASAASFAANGVLFEPGIPPIMSPDSIRAFIQSFPGVKVDSATLTADTIEVLDNVALVWGTYFEMLRFEGQTPSTQRGKFVMEWKMYPPRNWLIERYYRIPLPDAAPPAQRK